MTNNHIFNYKKAILLFISITLIAVVGFLMIYNLPQNQLNRQLSLGEKYLLNEQFDEAIIAFEKVLKIDPNIVDAYVGLSKAYESKEDLNKAIQILEQGYEITKDASLEKQKTEKISELNQKNNQSETADANDVENKKDSTEINTDIEESKGNNEEEMMRLLEKQASLIFVWASFDGFDAVNFDVTNAGNWYKILIYSQMDAKENQFLPIPIEPLGYVQTSKYPAEQADWILSNVYNIPENNYSNIHIDDFLTRDEDYYYMEVDGLGIYEADKARVLQYNKNDDNTYDITLIVDSFGTMYSIDLNAYIKTYNGKPYWSYNKIEVAESYNGDIFETENNVNLTKDANTMDTGILQSDDELVDQLISFEELCDDRYKNIGSSSVNLVGYARKKHYEASNELGGSDYDYMCIEFEHMVDIDILDSDSGNVYTSSFDSIPIVWYKPSENLEFFDQMKIAVRGKGFNSIMGSNPEKLVVGSIIALE